MKGVLKNTAMFAKVALADILETVRRFFTSLRFVQNDRLLPPISLENLKSKNLGKTVVILKREALKNLLKHTGKLAKDTSPGYYFGNK